VFGLTAAVDPTHVPVPHNLAERIVFRNLYETLVTVDGDGRTRPGLASRWESAGDGMVWIFTLRAGAVFWDGSPVTAETVRDCWRYRRGSSASSPLDWPGVAVLELEVLDAARLAVTLAAPCPDFPYLLAHPSLAIFVRRAGWLWPVGSGPCRLSAGTLDPVPDLVCRPNIHHPDRPLWRRFTFRVLPAADPRDLPSRGVDLFIVSGRPEREFLAALPDLVVAPLPWHRLYLLTTPESDAAAGGFAPLTAADREALARDATASDACAWPRLVLAPEPAARCPVRTGADAEPFLRPRDVPTTAPPGVASLGYRDDDPDARRLAERLAVLHEGVRATGLGPAAFAHALQSGGLAGYVLAVERSASTACLQLAGLLGRTSWLEVIVAETSVAGDAASFAAVPFSKLARELEERRLVQPLVAVRRYVAARRDVAGLDVAWDGTPLVARIGRRADLEDLP
jgi:hypothetical protein